MKLLGLAVALVVACAFGVGIGMVLSDDAWHDGSWCAECAPDPSDEAGA